MECRYAGVRASTTRTAADATQDPKSGLCRHGGGVPCCGALDARGHPRDRGRISALLSRRLQPGSGRRVRRRPAPANVLRRCPQRRERRAVVFELDRGTRLGSDGSARPDTVDVFAMGFGVARQAAIERTGNRERTAVLRCAAPARRRRLRAAPLGGASRLGQGHVGVRDGDAVLGMRATAAASAWPAPTGRRSRCSPKRPWTPHGRCPTRPIRWCSVSACSW